MEFDQPAIISKKKTGMQSSFFYTLQEQVVHAYTIYDEQCDFHVIMR
jgi:hypothetical protein